MYSIDNIYEDAMIHFVEEIVEHGVNWYEGITKDEYNNNALKEFVQTYNLTDYDQNLQDLMNESDYQYILSKSNYKP